MRKSLSLLGLLLLLIAVGHSQPVNDNCANASVIAITNGGYGLGTFTSINADLTNATVQPGENFYSTISAAGENKKSVWYKFTLPTARNCVLTLAQPTSTIPSNAVGFTVYKANSCFPTSNQADSALLAAQSVFGYSTNPCLKPGEYWVQVSSTNAANGIIYVQLQLADPSPAPYDIPTTAYNFGVLPSCQNYVDFATGCQTVQDSTEVCPALGPNYRNYTQSAWLTFKAPHYFDWIDVSIGPQSGCCFNNNTQAIFAYNLYRGDYHNTPINGMTVVDGCVVDTFHNYDPYLTLQYLCQQLAYDSTYSIQIFFDKTFADNVRVFVNYLGVAPAGGTQPTTTGISVPNQLGTLPQGNTNVVDHWGCNSRISQNTCGPSNPATGVHFTPNNGIYDLNDWYTFTIAQPSNVNFNVYGGGNQPAVRIFSRGVTASCAAMDTTVSLYAQFLGSTLFKCMPAGNYSMQILGNDDYVPNWGCTWRDNLGQQLNVDISLAVNQAYNHYSLVIPGAVDTVNRTGNTFGALQQGVSYNTGTDTFGCENTVLPAGNYCNKPYETKVVYHEFNIGDADGNGSADSGVISILGSFSWNYWYANNILYRGDANSLAIAQNHHFYADTITGLSPSTPCFGNNGGCQQTRACVVPGMYTLVTFGDSTLVGQNTSMTVQETLVTTIHRTGPLAENMNNIIDTMNAHGSTSVNSGTDHFSCYDNADSIGGQAPCGLNGRPATKAIYRQFYLSTPALVTITSSPNYDCSNSGILSLFNGQATNGLGTLTPVGGWSCFYSQYTGPCTPLPVGWYTVVAYGEGPSYSNPTGNYGGNHGYGGDIGLANYINIAITQAPDGPKYDYPYKAAIDTSTHLPFVIRPKPNSNSAAYPVTDTTYTLYTEHYNCTTDTPFSLHPVAPCTSNYQPNRVTYYVFQLPQMAYVHIGSLNGYMAEVFPFDVRVDSALMLTTTPVQPCINSGDYIELCRLQAGTYTLVVFPPDNAAGSSITPTIYTDNVGYSRFDNALSAYDFATIPEDSTWYSGKVGDVNPLDATRAASNDFFYCTTGAQVNDPNPPSCYLQYDSLVYGSLNNNFTWDATRPGSPYTWPRRNLWYTFVLNDGGYCHVRVNNVTPDKTTQYPFTVFRSDVSGTLPFSTVISSGAVDSTLALGLTSVVDNYVYYCANQNEVTFFRPPCNSVPQRYYILVDNPAGMEPNSQAEVTILYDTINTTLPLYDHYSDANVINGSHQTAPPYNNLPMDTGVFMGGVDNFTCATADATDPNPCACVEKDLWYKFTVTQAGYIRLRYIINGATQTYVDNCQMGWYKDIIPGDSTSTGLVNMGNVGNTYYDYTLNCYWYQSCILPGTYYILMTGCTRNSETVQPVVWLLNDYGDYCTNPVTADITNAGTSTMTAVIDCHTIGEAFGEDGTNMGCLIPIGDSVPEYKSNWFKFTIHAGDTFDITPILSDNTNVPADQVRYRLLYGNCSAMNPGSCFVTANTVNTFNCLSEGTYYIQVVEPHNQFGYPFGQVTGNITINVNAVRSSPGCIPASTCFAIAGFVTTTDCNNDSIYFVNQSSQGDSISYHWDLGYAGLTSTLKNPVVLYPVPLDSQSYNVTLITTNLTCNKGDTLHQAVAVYKKEHVYLGNDTTICSPDTLTLHATSFVGTTYLWSDNSTDSVLQVTATGQYYVANTFQGCIVHDTINVNVNQGPVVNLGPDHILCPGVPYTVTFSNANGETYAWSNGSTSNTFTTSTPGTYWVHSVLGSCIKDDTITLPSPANIHPLGNDTIICNNGSITLDATVAGATGYTWDDASTNATRTVTDTGTYIVNIAISGCTLPDTIHITPAPQPVPVISGDSNLCYVGDSAAITANAGFTSYTWSTGETTMQIVVYAPNTYYVSVTNSLGCVGVDSFVVRQSPAIMLATIDSMVSCNGLSDGQIQLTANGGTVPFTYSWSNGPVTQNISGLAVGPYTVTVNDVIGCRSTKTDIITQPLPLQITTGDSATLCYGDSTGKIFTAVSGGTAPYAYLWSNGAVTDNIQNIPAGAYTVTVTDAHGCTITKTNNVGQPTALQIVLTDSNVLCYGTPTGKIASAVTGGTSPYSYVWTGGVNSPNINNLPIGNYVLTVTDAHGCVDTASATLTQPSELYLEAAITEVSCANGNNGAIAVTDTGGTPGYTYQWGGGQQTATIQALTAATYYLTVLDANGCAIDTSFTITQPAAVVIHFDSSFAPLCYGSADGRIYASATGGNAPYTFAWSNGTAGIADTILVAGTYVLTVTDLTQCSVSDSVTLTRPDSISITAAITNVTCNGANNGRIQLTVTGGTPAYTYAWSNTATTALVTQLAPATYSVVVTDSHSCTAQLGNLVVTEPPVLDVSVTATNEACVGAGNGTVSSSTTGGTAPYTYGWNNSAITANISNLHAGNYIVTVTDAKNCTDTASAQVVIETLLAMAPEVQEPVCPPVDNGYVILHVTGVTPPYTYTWTGANASGDSVINLAPGTYAVTVADAYNCKLDTSFTLQYQYTLTLSTPSDIMIHLGHDTVITTTSNGSSLHYNWSPAASLSCNDCSDPIAAPLATTLYVVTAEDANGCIATDSVTIIVTPDYSLYVPNAFTPNNDGNNDYFEIFGNKAAIVYISVAIFDRWGEKVFESNDINFMWDGNFRGNALPPSVFTYQLNVSFSDGHADELRKGSVTLIK